MCNTIHCGNTQEITAHNTYDIIEGFPLHNINIERSFLLVRRDSCGKFSVAAKFHYESRRRFVNTYSLNPFLRKADHMDIILCKAAVL